MDSQPLCPQCGTIMKRKVSIFGDVSWKCPNPKCGYDEDESYFRSWKCVLPVRGKDGNFLRGALRLVLLRG